MKAVSLFSGAGGCDLGFEKAGIEIISAYDNSVPAIRTYNKNFGKDKCKNVDLSQCDFKKIRDGLGLAKGDVDLLIGGPPCQGFTTAGNRFWDDPRNQLVINYAQALELFFPRWFMMENVEGILTTAKGEFLIEFIKKMTELGYSVYLKKIYMQEYGVPQRRKRVIIVGNREGKAFEFPKAHENAKGSIYRNSSYVLRDVISDLETNEQPGLEHKFRIMGGIQLERIKALKVGQSMKDLPVELQHESFKRRASRRVCDGTPTEKRGGAPSGLKRLSYDEPCLTITSSATSEFIHPNQNRPLTIRECARIQTFPDSFIFCGSDAEKILQVGNAIPPNFAYLMAKQIKECDKHKSGKMPPALIKYEVTKAEAKSPALARTCNLLDRLKMENYEQLVLDFGGGKRMASKQQLAFYKTFAQHGTGKAMIEIEPKDLLLLIHIAYLDINPAHEPSWLKKEFVELARKEFYSITPQMIEKLPDVSVDETIDGLINCGATDTNNVIYLYLKNLAELYRRRFKFYNILKTQSFPSSDQIGLRCLLEYGNCADVLLFNWMCWRKLIYDIDNRSAQETGYLFEPIMASCLGGEPVAAQRSPVKRVVDGKVTKDGRQVDCYIQDKKEVYELKLRVTIAASGQGRFNEEMTFPYEARVAGLKPVLVVFDPTPSPLLDKLKEEYFKNGGQYAIGEDAWDLLEKRAGDEMGRFISKYIKPPISEMETESIVQPYSVKLSVDADSLIIEGEDGNSYIIERD